MCAFRRIEIEPREMSSVRTGIKFQGEKAATHTTDFTLIRQRYTMYT